MLLVKFIAGAHIQPPGPLFCRAQYIPSGHGVDDRLAQQGIKILALQFHQYPIGGHGHRGVTRFAGKQRLFAKPLPLFQHGHRGWGIIAHTDGHLADAFLEDVATVCCLTLADNHIPLLVAMRLQPAENFQNIARRHPMKQLGFKQSNHPLTIILVSGVGVDIENHVTGRLVPGKNGVQPKAIKANHTDLGQSPSRTAAGLGMLQRMPGCGISGTDGTGFARFIGKLYLAAEQIDGGVVLVAKRKKGIS